MITFVMLTFRVVITQIFACISQTDTYYLIIVQFIFWPEMTLIFAVTGRSVCVCMGENGCVCAIMLRLCV